MARAIVSYCGSQANPTAANGFAMRTVALLSDAIRQCRIARCGRGCWCRTYQMSTSGTSFTKCFVLSSAPMPIGILHAARCTLHAASCTLQLARCNLHATPLQLARRVGTWCDLERLDRFVQLCHVMPCTALRCGAPVAQRALCAFARFRFGFAPTAQTLNCRSRSTARSVGRSLARARALSPAL